MSAFTYDSWNVLIAKYKNKFGVDQDTNTDRRDYGFFMYFRAPGYFLRANDVNYVLYNNAETWCPTGSIDNTRIVWSQGTMDEIDAVFNGSRCGSIDENAAFYSRGTFTLLSTDTESDPIFAGRTLVNSISLDYESINNLTFSPSFNGFVVEAYFSITFTRSPAPELSWTDIFQSSSSISGGKTAFSNPPFTIPIGIYNVSSFVVTPRYRVVNTY